MCQRHKAIAAATGTTVALLTATIAFAGSIVRMESRDYSSNPPKPSTLTVAVEGSALRLDAVGESSDEAGSLVFKSDLNQMTAIDHSRKQYFLLDEAAMSEMAGQVDDAMRQMQEALDELPPEQRAMAEQMMQQRMASVRRQAGPRTIEKTGATDSINGYDCEMYDVSEQGRKTRDMCVTSWDNLEGGADFAKVMIEMAGFFEHMRQKFSQSGMDLMGSRSDVFSHMREINGFPVRSRDYDVAGKLTNDATLISSEIESIDPALFAAPEGYEQQTMQQ